MSLFEKTTWIEPWIHLTRIIKYGKLLIIDNDANETDGGGDDDDKY